MHPDLSGSVTSIVSCASLVTFAFVTNVFKVPQHFFLIFIASVLYFALIMLRNRAYKVATASFVTMIFALTPLFVAILSFFFLQETLAPIQAVGGLFIVGSTIFAERYKM
jgi:drug/metabolite transporter (DMT)-like permease